MYVMMEKEAVVDLGLATFGALSAPTFSFWSVLARDR